jgi:NADP-dependent 3-hydroxy acid dehydrogenase YdfG
MISLKNKIVLITGASAGIGKACAQQFAAQGANVILTARRMDRITALADSLTQEHGVKIFPLCLDVSDKAKVQSTLSSLPGDWKNIDILVNNAGAGVTSELMQNANPDDWDVIIDTNVKGLLYVTRAILPTMIERNCGHIVNIGSTAGHAAFMGGNVYSASKHAVKAITRSLRIDLKGHKIKVSAVDPGMVQTEFSEARWDKERSDAFYKGIEPLVGDDIADAVIYCTTRPAHVSVSEIMVCPQAQAAPTVMHRDGDAVKGLYD